MPATVPACCGSRCRSRLIFGKARDMFVRSINAIVYMMRATGMMRIQRCEIGDGAVPVPESRSCAVFIMMKNSLAFVSPFNICWRAPNAPSPRLASRCCLWLYLVHPYFGVLILVMGDCEIVAVQFWNQDACLSTKAAGNSRQQRVMVWIPLFKNIQLLI